MFVVRHTSADCQRNVTQNRTTQSHHFHDSHLAQRTLTLTLTLTLALTLADREVSPKVEQDLIKVGMQINLHNKEKINERTNKQTKRFLFS